VQKEPEGAQYLRQGARRPRRDVPQRPSEGQRRPNHDRIQQLYGHGEIQNALRLSDDSEGVGELIAAVLAFDIAGLGAFAGETTSSNRSMMAIADLAGEEDGPQLAAQQEAFLAAARAATIVVEPTDDGGQSSIALAFTKAAHALGATAFSSGLTTGTTHDEVQTAPEGSMPQIGLTSLQSIETSPTSPGPLASTTPSPPDLNSGREALGVHEDEWAIYNPDIDGRHKGSVEIGFDPDADDSQDAFYLLYQGEDAKQFHWLQFVWAEIIGKTPDGSWVSCPDAPFATSATRSYRSAPGGSLTSNGSPENINHASHDGGFPWKDTHFVHEGETTGAVDAPQFKHAAVMAAIEEHNLKAVKLRQHYEVFLVKNERRIASHSTITMDWATQDTLDGGRSLPSRPPVEVTVKSNPTPSKLPEPFRSVLHWRFRTAL